MSASATDIADLRDMVAEPTTTTYSDDDLAAVIERFALIDSGGYEPDDVDWTATYDLNAAAANIWGRKRAALATMYDFSADGGTFHRQQAFENAGKMARHYSARRAPSSLRVHVDHRFERDMQSTYWDKGGVSEPGAVVNAYDYGEEPDEDE